MAAIARADFIINFNAAIEALAGAERITKEKLLHLSRDVLGALHGIDEYEATLTGDIQFINKLLTVLTPMNRKTFVLYCREFSGFHFDDKMGEFTKKIQKDKVSLRDKVVDFLANPNNNIWTWAERNIKVERQPFQLNKLTAMVEKAREELNGDDKPIILAIMEGGLSIADILAVMEEMGQKEEQV